MQELRIKHDQTVKAVAFTIDQKKLIETKIQNALLKVLIQNGGEVIRLKPQGKGKLEWKSELAGLDALPHPASLPERL